MYVCLFVSFSRLLALASVPNVPRNLTVSFITSTSVYISWESPNPREHEPINNFTMATHYIVQYNDVNVTVFRTSYTAFLVNAGIVEVTVAGVNSFGRGERALIRVSPPLVKPSPSVVLVESPSLTPTVTNEPERKGNTYSSLLIFNQVTLNRINIHVHVIQ